MQMAEEPSEVWEVLELSHLEQVLFLNFFNRLCCH
jgi:hypothetical protein